MYIGLFSYGLVLSGHVKKGDCKLELVQRRAEKVTKRMEIRKVTERV